MSGVLGGLPIALLLVGICAPISGWVAMRRFRNPAVWFILGALTGPLALVLLAAAPPGRCPNCDTAVVGWHARCDACGARLRDGAAPSEAFPMEAFEPETRPWPQGTAERRPATRSILERAALVAPPTPIDSARAGHRRDPRPPRDQPPLRRTTPVAPARSSSVAPPLITASSYQLATGPTDENTGEVLSTGVYISGNAGLEIGACYAIARSGDILRVFGPVDAGQLTIRHEGAVNDIDVTAMDDRVIISGREGRSSLAIVFRTIGGMRAAELESALAPSIAGYSRPL